MPPVTSRVPGDGTGTATFTIPGSGLDVETVRVSVDASAAGGPVTATVTITDQSGVVIATKPQNATIPAGAIGSATWALRLDDETTASTGGGIQFNTDNEGGWLYVGGGAFMPAVGATADMSPSSIGLQDKSGGGIALWDGNAGGGISLLSGPKAGVFFGGDGVVIQTSGAGGITVRDRAGAGASFSSTSDTEVEAGTILTLNADQVNLNVAAGVTNVGGLTIANLPVVNPGAPPGQVWNNGGVLSIT